MSAPLPRVDVALLECDHVDAPLQHIDGDYGEMFVRRFAAHAPELRFHRIDVIGGAPLPDPATYDALLVTGSRHGARDPLPWIAELSEVLRDAHAAGTPTVGICFGHQVIAQALGGRVERAAVGWGVGVHRASVVAPQRWMEPPAEAFSLLVSHQDQVVELPADATLVATSDHAPVAAFQVGSLVGFQGHPEFSPSYAEALLATRLERVGPTLVDTARATLGHSTDHAAVTTWLAAALRGTA